MKVNIQARIKRHSRVLKDSLVNKGTKQIASDYSYKAMLFIILFIIPIYPTIASVFHNNTVYDFYRGDIDESSILGSYFGDEETSIDVPLAQVSEDSFLSVNTILNDIRDLSGTNDIAEYTIKGGDNISSIAYKFRVSNNSIYWANNFTKKHIIQPGDIVKIPPVSGLIHLVKSGESVGTLAKKYDIEPEKILSQNLLSTNDKLIAGEVIVIPGAIKKKPKPVYKKPLPKYLPKNYAKKTYKFAKYASSQYVDAGGSYKLKWRKPQHTFYWGNCTWYIGQYKNVNWGGNANQWIRNAKAKGHSTGSSPTLGSIVQLVGRGYNPRYGHVGIVMDILKDHIIVSDMNYRRLGEVTYRKIPKNDRAIAGYIYVD